MTSPDPVYGEKPWATWIRDDGAVMGMTAAGRSWVITTPLRELEKRVEALEARIDEIEKGRP